MNFYSNKGEILTVDWKDTWSHVDDRLVVTPSIIGWVEFNVSKKYSPQFLALTFNPLIGNLSIAVKMSHQSILGENCTKDI